MDFHPFPVNTVENGDIKEGSTVEGQTFVRYRFKDVAAKNVAFHNCNFSFAVFTRVYFRDAKFHKCQFIGARFYDCNFRGAELTRCDFRYAVFQGTLISPEQVIANLPEWPNVKRELLRVHRVNAQSVGDVDSEKLFVREEMAAIREHYRRAREKKEAYYSEKYKGWRKWMEIRWKSFCLWFGRFTWGWGEYLSRLLLFVGLSLVVLTIVVAFQAGVISTTKTLADIGLGLLESLKTTLLLFLDLPQSNQVPVHWVIMIVIALLRYLAIGLFVAVLFRKFSKR